MPGSPFARSSDPNRMPLRTLAARGTSVKHMTRPTLVAMVIALGAMLVVGLATACTPPVAGGIEDPKTAAREYVQGTLYGDCAALERATGHVWTTKEAEAERLRLFQVAQPVKTVMIQDEDVEGSTESPDTRAAVWVYLRATPSLPQETDSSPAAVAMTLSKGPGGWVVSGPPTWYESGE